MPHLDIPVLLVPQNGLTSNGYTGRLRLTPFTDAHIKTSYINWLNNPDVVRYSNQRFFVHTEKTCRQYLSNFIGSSNQFLAIEDILSGQMIGTLTLYVNLHHQTADIGILIGSTRLWGRGYGQEAFGLAMDNLIQCSRIRKVTAGTMACNLGMIKIMERCGMVLEATRKDHELLDGQPIDVLYFSKFIRSL